MLSSKEPAMRSWSKLSCRFTTLVNFFLRYTLGERAAHIHQQKNPFSSKTSYEALPNQKSITTLK
jgi:hypothetical protein